MYTPWDLYSLAPWDSSLAYLINPKAARMSF